MKNIRILSENFQFLVVKFSIYLNRRVFVMNKKCTNKKELQQRNLLGTINRKTTWGFKLVLLARNLALKSRTAPNYKYLIGPHKTTSYRVYPRFVAERPLQTDKTQIRSRIHNAASDQGLHCLPLIQQIFRHINSGSGLVQIILLFPLGSLIPVWLLRKSNTV